MIKNTSARWLALASCVLGLASCDMWNSQRSEQVQTHQHVSKAQQQQVQHAKVYKKKPVQKTYATKDPSEQLNPGPSRKAAPQLPVIQ